MSNRRFRRSHIVLRKNRADRFRTRFIPIVGCIMVIVGLLLLAHFGSYGIAH